METAVKPFIMIEYDRQTLREFAHKALPHLTDEQLDWYLQEPKPTDSTLDNTNRLRFFMFLERSMRLVYSDETIEERGLRMYRRAKDGDE